jgi:hypothetical protein
MLRSSKGPIIQVDRLIFDTRNKTKESSNIQSKNFRFIELINKKVRLDVSLSLNKTDKEDISSESYFFIPSNKIEIIRLTLEDLNKDENKIYAMGQQSLSV